MSQSGSARQRFGFLDWVEWLGNKLPEPVTLFGIGIVVVLVLSHIAATQQWSVQNVQPRPTSQPVLNAAGEAVIDPATGKPKREWVRDEQSGQITINLIPKDQPVVGVSLVSAEGIWWILKNWVTNFINFPPLGLILTTIVGIGLAEKCGLLAAAMKAFMLVVPAALLTPAMVFIGTNATIASDAPYIVLPPLAAALYRSVGRSPLVGIAAVFAGVGGGFSAGALLTGSDPLMAGLTTSAVASIDPDYIVAATSNWWFKMASCVLITLVGWGVSAYIVEPRFAGKPAELGGAAAPSSEELDAQRLTRQEIRGLWVTIGVMAAMIGTLLAAVMIPGFPLYGEERNSPRWVTVIVPIIFLMSFGAGIAYGVAVGKIRSDRDAYAMIVQSLAGMGPVLALAFFAAQFLAMTNHSNLGRMLAIEGGVALAGSQLSPVLIMIAFIFLTMGLDFLIGSMSAKYALMSPIFVPMFMFVGISPELTQMAYRIGDSVSNNIVPLNAYVAITLAFIQRYVPTAGLGTIFSLMMPYSIAFAISWTVLLIVWMWLGIPLGPRGPLTYTPAL